MMISTPERLGQSSVLCPPTLSAHSNGRSSAIACLPVAVPCERPVLVQMSRARMPRRARASHSRRRPSQTRPIRARCSCFRPRNRPPSFWRALGQMGLLPKTTLPRAQRQPRHLLRLLPNQRASPPLLRPVRSRTQVLPAVLHPCLHPLYPAHVFPTRRTTI